MKRHGGRGGLVRFNNVRIEKSIGPVPTYHLVSILYMNYVNSASNSNFARAVRCLFVLSLRNLDDLGGRWSPPEQRGLRPFSAGFIDPELTVCRPRC